MRRFKFMHVIGTFSTLGLATTKHSMLPLSLADHLTVTRKHEIY